MEAALPGSVVMLGRRKHVASAQGASLDCALRDVLFEIIFILLYMLLFECLWPWTD